jgi:hypothetical protein
MASSKIALHPLPPERKWHAGGLNESEDRYPAVTYLDARHRVIECRDAIQWIVQVREGKRWVGTSYCRNRDVLIERSGAKGDALAILRALPEMHP